MRWNGFGRSVGFAAIAAAGSAAWLLCVGPVLGGRRAFALWLVGLTATYVGGLAEHVRGRVGAAALTAAVGLGLLLVAPGNRELILGLAVVIAVARSVFLWRTAPARAVVVEGMLLLGSLAFAAALGGASLRGIVLGTWGFFLVQSFFFLIPGDGTRPSPGRTDPFAAAHARALALLEHPRRA